MTKKERVISLLLFLQEDLSLRSKYLWKMRKMLIYLQCLVVRLELSEHEKVLVV